MKDDEVAIITHDKIAESDVESKVGTIFDKQKTLDWFYEPYEDEDVEWEDKLVRWKMYDDDGEHYYSGLLRNDGECIVQQMLLAWGANDAGCTRIEVFIDGKWKQEIA
jgi:hypothetical protein